MVAPQRRRSVRGEKFPTLSLPSLPSPQDYLRNKMLERSFPEMQQFISKLEPILKDLLDHTSQAHSIASIVDTMDVVNRLENQHLGQDVVLVWPSHPMQFIEYFNVVRAMEDPANQDAHLYAAYQSLLSQFYRTESRPKHKMPMAFLNRDARKLVKLWCSLTPQDLARFPVSDTDRRVLATLSLTAGDVFYSPILTAFELKQYVTLMVMRPALRVFLDVQFPVTPRDGASGLVSRL